MLILRKGIRGCAVWGTHSCMTIQKWLPHLKKAHGSASQAHTHLVNKKLFYP